MPDKPKGKDGNNVINLMRFAYDIFRYSAIKFQVPSQNLAVWEGPENDYGCSDFISVVSRLILEHQINMRQQLNPAFREQFAPRKRNSFEHIGKVCGDLIGRITGDTTLGIIANVELSLATVCELIQFLYSENSNLFLVQLAELWFLCFLKPNRAKFKRKGGLKELYRKGKEKQKNFPDALINTFIHTMCIYYRDSLQVDLEEKYFNSVRVYKQKNVDMSHTKEGEDPPLRIDDIDLPSYIYLTAELPSTSVKDEDSGVNLPPNPLLGVTPPNEMYDFLLGGDSPLSKNLPEESAQDLSRRPKKQSYLERIRTRKTSSRSSVEQGHGQLRSDSSLASGSKQSYDLQGARSKDRAQNTGSSGLQTGESSFCLGVQQGIGKLSSDISKATGSTQSYERQGARPKVLEQNTGSSDLSTGISSLCSSGEQSLEQLSLDPSGTKWHAKRYSKPFDTLLESQILANYARRSLDLNKDESDLDSSGKQNVGHLSFDSSVLKKSDISSADDITSQNYPDEICQVPTKDHSESSSEEETEKEEIPEQ